MKKYIILPCVLFTVIFISSCKNDNAEDLTIYNVTISILEPEDNAVFNAGQELHMEVDFDGSKPLQNYEVLAVNNTTGDTIAHYLETTSENFIAFHEHAEDLMTVGVSNCTLTASAWETNYADRISSSLSFTINP